MVKSWSLPIAGTCDAEASVPRTDWEVIPLQLDQLNNLQPIHESQPYPRHIQGRNIGLFWCWQSYSFLFGWGITWQQVRKLSSLIALLGVSLLLFRIFSLSRIPGGGRHCVCLVLTKSSFILTHFDFLIPNKGGIGLGLSLLIETVYGTGNLLKEEVLVRPYLTSDLKSNHLQQEVWLCWLFRLCSSNLKKKLSWTLLRTKQSLPHSPPSIVCYQPA